MTDRPILFSAPMICAQRDGRKTQTRRTLKLDGMLDPKPDVWEAKKIDGVWWFVSDDPECGGQQRCQRRYAEDDRLWVRETFSFERRWVGTKPKDVPAGVPVWYWADGNPPDGDWTKPIVSIHMPRWVSRLTNIVTDVRVQRLQEISEADCIAEGPPSVEWQPGRGGWMVPSESQPHISMSPRTWYRLLWDTINGEGSWLSDPWVIVIHYNVAKANIDEATP